MDYRYLGNSGLKVSELCLGAMTFGRESDEPTSRVLLDRFVDAGGNFLDTADVYSHGASEEILGRWLRGRARHDLVVATKVRFAMGAGPNDVGLSRNHIRTSVEASLRRLGTDYIDLYQIHCWDPGTPLEETLRTLDELVQAGLVRYVGASNLSGWQLQKAVDLSRHRGWEAFVSLQPQYNLLCRSPEWELLPVCAAEGLGVLPWSPLRGGWLAGGFRRGMNAPPAGSRIEKASAMGWGERWSAHANEHTWSVLDTLHAIAHETGKSVAQIALKWVSGQPGVTAPIIGVRTPEHLEDNLGAIGWELEPSHREALDRVSHITPPYPHDFLAAMASER
ncbi:aldo/keto reductase [Haliangium ochraceum]|uniref:Aldo/keto reductase n=1 Tax=Haliangium ochraceum (strain DSM 14365 / JCM 11303 / SMP-2) TaxID=502025 RepID=D0LRL4_HALO1|nr:aldo/keto reductase [Haliangium ochraceum]ACY19006.1 aldo/keto reductase [Haliangium ochraceum DSM 14365]